MHIGPIPQRPTTKFTVHVPVKHMRVNGEMLYQKIGIDWPALAPAVAFQKAYEESNPRHFGQTVIVEQTTIWTRVSDYANNYGQGSAVPSQRRPERERSDRHAEGTR